MGSRRPDQTQAGVVDDVVRVVTDSLTPVALRPDVVQEVVRAAVEAQATPARHYHTPIHLREMLTEVERLASEVSPAVAATVAWHDCVYEPTRSDNEARSAARARADLAGVVPDALVDHVVDLIGSTTTHEVADHDGDGALVHDADLWILSAPPARHAAYVRQVRAEYAHLTDAQWQVGRREVLTTLREDLTTCGYLVGEAGDRARRGDRARANIDRELATLHA